MNPRTLFAELKRRNVIRMAGLYLIGAWLLTQVASTLLPAFDAPSWALRGLIITLALGFIPAVIFSWVFELTPEGLKRDEDVAPERSITPRTGRRMDRMIIVVLVLALGYFAFDKFVLTPRREAALVSSAVPNESKSVINAKSIAVLPFENLSEEKANAYFTEAPPGPASFPTTITKEMASALHAKGYSMPAVSRMTPGQAHRILSNSPGSKAVSGDLKL